MRTACCVMAAFLAVGEARPQVGGAIVGRMYPAERSGTQFLMIVRDDDTKNLMENYTLSLDRAEDKGQRYREELRCSDMNIVLVTLKQGSWRFRVYADGYDQEVIDGVEMTGGGTASQSTYAWETVDSFTGTTVAVPVYLKKSENGKTRINVRPFLNDTIFYSRADVPPEPIGGIDALRKRILSLDLSKNRAVRIAGTVSLVAYINKSGEVVRVDVTQRVDPQLDGAVVESIRRAQFTPAKILGTPVSSRLAMSLEFDLKPDGGKRK
jgi:TonB family protein